MIEAMLSLSDDSLNNQKIILHELNSFLADCTQDLYDLEINFEDAGLLEKLLFQIVYHNSSILDLSNGSVINVREKNIKINDLTAMYSLARLQIETFVNLAYIFFIDCEYSTQIRACVYKIHGLRKQIELTKNHLKDFIPVSKIRNELALELNKIRKLEEFKKLSSSKKNKCIWPKHAKLIKPIEIYPLIEIGKLSKIHSLYSNHIHSEYISIRQLNSATKQDGESERSFSTVLTLCSRITSLTISSLQDKCEFYGGSYSKISIRLKTIIKSLNKISSQL